MILGCHFRLEAGRAAPERFLRAKRKNRVRTNFLPPEPENQPRNALFAKMSFKMTKKALSTEAFWAHGRFFAFLGAQTAFWPPKSHFGVQNALLAPKSKKCAKVRGILILEQETSS